VQRLPEELEMTTPPKDTTERDELAKALLAAMVRYGSPGTFNSAASDAFKYADAYMAEKERRNG